MVLPRLNSVKTSIFTASEGGWGRASEIGCGAVEVRDRPELFRVVVWIDRSFETTGIEPWTYLLSPGRLDFCLALQVVLTLPQQRLHYLPRLLPIPSTYKLNGSSFGRPDVDLMFAKWAFNNVVVAGVQAGCGLHSYEALWSTELPCARGVGALSGGARA
eukprot:scaffold78799_cov48-Phaeocystis_antarctica.AAC.1